MTSSAVVGRGDLEHAIGQRRIQQRHANRQAVQLALQFRIDEADRGRGTGGRRNQRHQRGARPPQILVRRVDDRLRVGHVVDRRDDAVPDADLFMDHLHHRSETIGGAGSGGDDVMMARVVEMVVDAHHDIERALLDRRGDDRLCVRRPRNTAQASGVRNFPEHSSTISTPAWSHGVSRSRGVAEADAPPSTVSPLGVGGDRHLPAAVDAVELEQMGGGLGAAFDLVDLDQR